MKNRIKFIKFAKIAGRVLLVIFAILAIILASGIIFRACSTEKQTAYASEADGIGTWVWNDINFDVSFPYTTFEFDFTSDGEIFNAIEFSASFMGNEMSYLFDGRPTLVFTEANNPNFWSAEEYKTIDIQNAPPAEFMTILRANAKYQSAEQTFTVTKILGGCTLIGADTIAENTSEVYQIAPNTGYTYPDSVGVTGASYTYDKSTGKITVSNATGNVEIRVYAKLIPVNFTVTKIGAGCLILGDDTIPQGGSAVYQIAPNNGYEMPKRVDVSVEGATILSYSETSGRLEITNATGNVTIRATAQESQAYKDGYNAGVQAGLEQANDIVVRGNASWEAGYSEGFNAGGEGILGTPKAIFKSVVEILNINLFGIPGFTVGAIVAVLVTVGVLLFILKVIRG